MASILVVGQEQRSLERFHRVLSAEGWRVRVAQGRAQALQAAALEPPDLVLAGAEVPGAEELAGAFRRSAGGPGIIVVMPESGLPTGPAVLGDDRLRLPFGDHDLVVAVRRLLAVAREAGGPAAPPVRLTSQEIFGDVLAEVEGQFASPAAPGKAQAGAAAASASPASQPARPGDWRDDGEMQRRLEETLSGVMRPGRTGAASGAPGASAPATARRGDTTGVDVETLLSRTLSELGARPKAGGATPAAGAGAAAGAARSAAAASGGAAAVVPAAPAAALASAGAPAAAASRAAPAAAASPVAAASAGPAAAAMPAASPAASVPAAAAETPQASEVQAPEPAPIPAASAPAGPAPAAAAPAAASAPVASPPPPAAAAPSASSAPASAAPAPSAPPASGQPREASGARRRFTGELDLSQLEEMARTRRKVEPSSRPGVTAPSASSPGASAAPAGPGSPRAAGMAPPVGARVGDDSPAATQRIQMVPREPAEAGEKFGQYTLLERIAVGGMAEVWKARMRGVEGFQKTVAIKKILPHMTDNADFVSMFIDEAKLAAQLSHPNIVHIYDLGKIGADYYIAMEYVEGKDLRSLLNAARQRGAALPLGLALLIAVRLASALGYAHRKRDFEGHEMGLVHRDVSPQNVLISFDGDVKLCDFGIAKAVSKVGQTQMGALKGKLQYMSPEQAMGTPVDARSDIFSLGTVLFEMLTGQRLFEGDSEMSVLEAVRQVKVRAPRQVDAAIPPEVDEIVMRALAGRPEDRFQSAGELEQRLEVLLYALKPSPSHSDLAAFVRRALEPLSAPTVRMDRRQAAAPPPLPVAVPAPSAVAAAAQRAAAPAPPFVALPGAPSGAPATLTPPAAAQLPPHMTTAAAPAASDSSAVIPLAPLGDAPLAAEGSRPGRLMLAAAAAVLIAVALLTWFLIGRRQATPQIGVPPGGSPAAGATATGQAAGTAAGLQPAGPAAPGGQAAPAGAGGSAAAKGAAAGAKAAPPGTGKVDVQGVVDQELARRAAAMKQQFEDQQKKLQQEIEKTKNGKAPDASASSPANASGTGASQAAQPGAGAAAGEPGRAQKGGGAPGAEPRAPAEPPAAAASSPGSGGQQQETAKERAAEAAGRAPAETAGTTAPSGAGSASRGALAAGAAGAATVPPKLVSTPKPRYPALARKMGAEGVVVLSILVDEQGRVEDVQLVDSQNVEFNEAALQVARGARFKPATRDGVPVKMWTRLRIPFKL